MAGVWARNVERLLGGPLSDLTAAQLRGVVAAEIEDGPQLDFKRGRYGKTGEK